MDPYLMATVSNFIGRCTFIEIVAGVKDFNDVLTSDDLLSALSTNNTAFQSQIYTSDNPAGEWKTCKDVYQYIATELPSHVTNQVAPYFAKRVMGLTSINNLLTTEILQKLGVAGQYFLNTSLTGQKMLEQAVLSNAFWKGADLFSLEYGDPAGYAASVAEKRAVSNWAVSAELAKEFIPLIQQVLQGLILGLFPVVFIISLFPGRMKVIQVYLTLLLWLTLWVPAEAIVNLIACEWADDLLKPAIGGNYSIMYLTAMSRYTAGAVSLAGNLMWSVPLVVYAMIKGSEMAVVSLAGRAGAVLQGAAASTSSEVATEGGLQSLARQGLESEARTMKESMSSSNTLRPTAAQWDELARSWGVAHEDAVKAYYQYAHGADEVFHSASNRMAESMASGAVGDAGTRETVGTVKAQRDIANQMAFEKIRERLGFHTAGEFQEFMTSTGLMQDFGNKVALQRAYEHAKAEGFKGNLADFQASISEAQYTKAYEDSDYARLIADRDYGGDLGAFYRSQIAYHQEMIQGILDKAKEHGLNPADMGRLEGHIKALSQIGRARGIEAEGERTFIQAEAGKVLNEGAKFAVFSMAAQKLGFKGKDAYEKLFSYLKAHQGKLSMVLNEDEAKHLSRILGKELHAGSYELSIDDKGNVVYAEGKTGTKIWEGSSVVEENKVASTSLSKAQAQRIAQAFDNALKAGDKSALAVVSALRKRGIDVFDENGNFDKDKYAQWLEGQNVQATFGRDALGREVITSLRGDKGILFMSESGISIKDVNLDQEVDKKTLESTSLSRQQAQRVAEAFDNALKSGDRSAVAVVNSLRKRGIDVFDEGGRFDKDKYAEWLTGQNVRVSFGTDKQGNQVITSMVGDDGIIFRSKSGITKESLDFDRFTGVVTDPKTGKPTFVDGYLHPVQMRATDYVNKFVDAYKKLDEAGIAGRFRNVGAVGEISTNKAYYSPEELRRLESDYEAYRKGIDKQLSLNDYVNYLQSGQQTILLDEKALETLSKKIPEFKDFTPGKFITVSKADDGSITFTQDDKSVTITKSQAVTIGDDVFISGRSSNVFHKEYTKDYPGYVGKEKAIVQEAGKYEMDQFGQASYDPYNITRSVINNYVRDTGFNYRNWKTSVITGIMRNLGASDELTYAATRFSIDATNTVEVIGTAVFGRNFMRGGLVEAGKVISRLPFSKNVGRVVPYEASAFHRPPEGPSPIIIP
ncbi:hypothetical protein JCM12825_01650 [Desulfurobacterium crinifex]